MEIIKHEPIGYRLTERVARSRYYILLVCIDNRFGIMKITVVGRSYEIKAFVDYEMLNILSCWLYYTKA